ncbi:hypothetical protein COLO4_34371 [Corchorus olitorius]|uniref:Uncharacterized protein n=1 Tax=Corchorus olitorius TaxID=93759 RepID=A0A1R3GL36_9ROSI|nr:hypothetical protein COLO4_34371 [Corchorus olitorius]
MLAIQPSTPHDIKCNPKCRATVYIPIDDGMIFCNLLITVLLCYHGIEHENLRHCDSYGELARSRTE